MLQKLGAARDTEDHVRAVEARRAAFRRGEQRIRDVAEQASPGGVVGQGAVPSRREHSRERAHSEQQQQDGEKDQGVGEAVRGHLPLLHGAVQVHGGRGRERVSIVQFARLLRLFAAKPACESVATNGSTHSNERVGTRVALVARVLSQLMKYPCISLQHLASFHGTRGHGRNFKNPFQICLLLRFGSCYYVESWDY